MRTHPRSQPPIWSRVIGWCRFPCIQVTPACPTPPPAVVIVLRCRASHQSIMWWLGQRKEYHCAMRMGRKKSPASLNRLEVCKQQHLFCLRGWKTDPTHFTFTCKHTIHLSICLCCFFDTSASSRTNIKLDTTEQITTSPLSLSPTPSSF